MEILRYVNIRKLLSPAQMAKIGALEDRMRADMAASNRVRASITLFHEGDKVPLRATVRLVVTAHAVQDSVMLLTEAEQQARKVALLTAEIAEREADLDALKAELSAAKGGADGP